MLLSKLLSVPDLQVAWLLLLMCAAPRCHYLLRALPPGYTAAFARQHDEAVLACLQELLANDGPPMWEVNATRRAQLPLQLGGLGFRSAETTRFAAHWASWADTLPTLRDRHPGIVADLLRQAEASRSEARTGSIAPSVSAALHAESCLRQAGFDAPSWPQLLDDRRPQGQAARSFGDPLHGWQRAATACLDAAACDSLLFDLDRASRALLLSQAGPGGSRALTVLPTAPEFRMPSDCMRVLLLRRLRLPLPHTPARCRCGGTLDALGDHRAACPTAGVLGPRGVPLEKAAARVCREGGARQAKRRRTPRAGNAKPRIREARPKDITLLVAKRCEEERYGSTRTNCDVMPCRCVYFPVIVSFMWLKRFGCRFLCQSFSAAWGLRRGIDITPCRHFRPTSMC